MHMRLAAAFALVLAASACRTPSARGESGRRVAGRTVEGLVEGVGRDDGTLTLRVGETRQDVLVAAEAEIRIDDFKGTFADIKEGQRVRASIDEVAGQTEGFRIEILDHGVPAPAVLEEAPEGGVEPGAAAIDDR
jgi:hypothetical protein